LYVDFEANVRHVNAILPVMRRSSTEKEWGNEVKAEAAERFGGEGARKVCEGSEQETRV
jgi:hypothetical protein